MNVTFKREDLCFCTCQQVVCEMFIFKVVIYPKNRIFCALCRFFENAINGHFNHSLTLFRGVFGGNMSYEDRICQKLVVCPIFCLRNALSNGCLHSLFQNFEGLGRFFKAIYSGIVT